MPLLFSGAGSQNYPPPVSPSSSRQKAWDLPHVQETYDQLLQGATDSRSRARLLVAATKESGAWLHALPVSSLGLYEWTITQPG